MTTAYRTGPMTRVAAFFDEERRFREYEEMLEFTGLEHLPPWQVYG